MDDEFVLMMTLLCSASGAVQMDQKISNTNISSGYVELFLSNSRTPLVRAAGKLWSRFLLIVDCIRLC